MARKKQRTLSALKAEASRWLSRAIRYEYANSNGGVCKCITCGVERPPNKMQAGHFLDGSRNGTRFIEKQIHPQCYACNVLLNGNKVRFFLVMQRVNGANWIKQIIALDDKPAKFERDDLEYKIDNYKKRAIIAEERWLDRYCDDGT